VRNWAFGLCGATAASLLILAFFLIQDGGKHLWECTVHFNRYYAASSTFDWAGVLGYLRAFWVHWWVLFLVFPALGIKPQSNLWFWLGIFVTAWVATGSSVYGHYYIILMPFWALLSARAVNQLAMRLGENFAWARSWLNCALTALVTVLLCVPQWRWITRSPEQFAADKLGGSNPFIESVPAARRLQELTSSRDFVFVAGSEPQILCYAERQSSTRFVITYPLMIPTPLARGYQLEAIQELEQHPPAIIALIVPNTSWLTQPASPPDLFNYIDQLVAKHYKRIGGYVVEGNNRRWLEPLPDQDLVKASIILFQRK
jgi:hypothetical protein